jgi:hypothetical protein
MGTGMTEDLAISTLAGDYGTPAAAYSVRKVRTAYSGALMDVRRSIDNVTSSIGFVSNGDLDTGSLLDFVKTEGDDYLPGAYDGLAAAYSLRKVSASYDGPSIQANNSLVYRDIGFDSNGNLDTGSLTSLVATGSNVLAGNYSGLAAAYSLRRVTSSYSGFAIEVQSGSVSQSIGFDSIGNLDTGSLLTFVGSGDAFVKTWYDQSGNNNHATQSVVASQPQIVSSGTIITQSNRPTIQFDGSGDNLLIPLQLTTGFDIFKTIRYTNVGGYPIILSEAPGVAGGFAFSRDPSNRFAITRKNQATITFTSTGSNNQVYVTNHYSTGVSAGNITVNFRLNGGSEETAALSSVITGSTSAIGMGNNFDYFAGTTHEILIYSSSQATNRTYISNNINAYYDIYTTSSTSTENAFVSTWYDQSGNNRHATQTATGSQPLIVSSGSLVTSSVSKPAMFFNSAAELNLSEINLTGSDYSFFLTYQKTSYNSNAVLFVDGTYNIYYDVSPSNLQGFGNDYISITGGSFPTGSLMLVGGIFNRGVNAYSYKDSILLGSGSATSNNQKVSKLFPASFAHADSFSSEILIYSSSQSSNRPLIENNINNYYNIYTGSNHGFVARWYDQSGNNRHATQTATGSQPVIVESGSIITENSRSALSFDGTSMFFNLSSNITATSPFSSFAVGRRSTNGTAMLFYGGSGVTHGLSVDDRYYLQKSSGYLQSNNTDTTNQQILLSGIATTTTQSQFKNSSEIASTFTAAGIATTVSKLGYYVDASPYYFNGKYQELSLYLTDQTPNRQAVEYGINNYYNIYPQTSSFATSSFAIYTTSGSVSASLNNRLTSGIPSSGPLGLITVSRTGSNSLTIARNGVTSSFAVPASGALSTGIYLGAINNNGLALGNSPLNLSFASVGTGLTGADVNNYTRLLTNLQFDLKRASLLNYYPEPFIAYSLRLLDINYTGPAIQVRRSSDNTTLDIGFNSRGLLDTEALLNFVGTGNGYIRIWYDQSGNQNNIGRTSNANQPIIVENGSVLLEAGKPTIRFDGGQSLYNQVGAFNTSVTSPFTILHTMKATGAGGLLDGDSTFEFGVRTLSDVSLDVNTSPGLRASYSNVRGQRNLFHYISNPNGNPTSMGVNTTQIAFKTTFNSITFTGVCLGAAYPIYNYVFGNMQEFIIYPYDMNANSTRLPVSSLINNYYQIY